MEKIVNCKWFRSREKRTNEIFGSSNQCVCPEEKVGTINWPSRFSHPTGMPYKGCEELSFPEGSGVRKRLDEKVLEKEGHIYLGCKYKEGL